MREFLGEEHQLTVAHKVSPLTRLPDRRASVVAINTNAAWRTRLRERLLDLGFKDKEIVGLDPKRAGCIARRGIIRPASGIPAAWLRADHAALRLQRAWRGRSRGGAEPEAEKSGELLEEDALREAAVIKIAAMQRAVNAGVAYSEPSTPRMESEPEQPWEGLSFGSD